MELELDWKSKCLLMQIYTNNTNKVACWRVGIWRKDIFNTPSKFVFPFEK